MHDEALLSWGWLNMCLSMGSVELIPCSALLTYAGFALLMKLSLNQPTSSYFSNFLPHPTVGSEQVAMWPAGVKPQH